MGRHRRCARLESLGSAALAVILGIGLISIAAPITQAASTTLYVDGKTGSDSHDGTSPGSAFKTIAKAANTIPSGVAAAGWTVVVQGYSDYIYRERPIPPGWSGQGTTSAHVVFRAADYVPGGTGYVKPIVSGGDLAPTSGHSWQSTSTPGVWRTPWTTAPFDYGKAWGPRGIAVFEDTTKWLWAYSSLSGLASAASKGAGGFWWDSANKQLYVSGVSTTGASGANPTGHTIDVIIRNAFLFNGTYGVRYVDVLGFVVQHSANGIAFAMGTDYGTAADNVVNANLYMGIQTRGYQGSSADPSVGHQITRNTGSWNTVQMIKADEGTQNSTFCDNSASRNGLQGIKLQGPPVGSSYKGTTANNTICDNDLHNNNYNPTGSTYNNSSGLTIANGALSTTVTGNDAWGNDVGIMVSQEDGARPAIEGVTLSWNRMWSNRRFGLYFFDGYYGRGDGHATSTRDAMWDNGIGVMADRGSTNKTLELDTIHANESDGIRVGGTSGGATSVTLKRSIVTDNAGYGIWVLGSNTATLSYDGFSLNTLGNFRGSVSKSYVNGHVAGYLSIDPEDPDFITIASDSYQYTAGPGATPIGAYWSDKTRPKAEGSTFFGLTPSRILDTYQDIQVSSPLQALHAVTFNVTDRFPGDPDRNVPANATAITGVLSVSHATVLGYLALTPDPIDVPVTSTINFPVRDARSTGVTVPLGPGGTLSVTYGGTATGTADVSLDITGYFIGGSSGSTYFALTPNRILDSRKTIGNMEGGLTAGIHRTFQVADLHPSDPTMNVPSTAVAVTGNLTVTRQTHPGLLALGPDPIDAPTTASLYFPVGDNRAAGLTIKLGSDGTLSVVYIAKAGSPASATAQVVFDVTGYFLPSSSGAMWVPVPPNRIVDSRKGIGVGSILVCVKSASFYAVERSNDPAKYVPPSAVGVTGTLTVTRQTTAGYLALTTARRDVPITSTLNFPYGDNRATGVTVPLGSGGVLWVSFGGCSYARTHVVFDVSGYFTR